MIDALHEPGTLVKARGREWLVLPGSIAPRLNLRALTGGDEALLDVRLENVEPATFPLPGDGPEASPDAARLLHGAPALALRRGAGPFRSFGQLGFEPRPYQLVPLLMALKLDPVRLLVADDVGIGKTIEAGLIARELIDRGEIDRLCVLCPPHLVDQWVSELRDRFHLRAEAVTAASASRLERGLPVGTSLFTAHPYTVVSLDYVKSDRRRSDFLRACPSFVIVDEAHACAGPGRGLHLRHRLLRDLAADPGRHLVLLTATPHSGDDAAFHLLLGLLHPDFERLGEAMGVEREELRARLGQHLVQRRRPDIEAWGQDTVFPRRRTTERTYRLTGPWQEFLSSVLDWCRTVTERAGSDTRRQRLTFWSTLALVRCVSSSPEAALRALRTRAGQLQDDVELPDWASQLLDGDTEGLGTDADDVEPGALATEESDVAPLVRQCEELIRKGHDPKLEVLVEHLKELLADGFNPVVFCRYIATAEYLALRLRKVFKDVTIDAVTGQLAPVDRGQRVEALGEADRRMLIATDCLSEGINLQAYFDAVVHYDLSWNPTRHEQREGRVDRYGQPSPEVRATLMFGADNPVDGAVLRVILRKAQRIREVLGVPVPVPDEGLELTQALLKAVMLRGSRPAESNAQQLSIFDLDRIERIADERWIDLEEKVRRNTTLFAQRRLKPEDVMPEWQRSQAVLGDSATVERFVERALSRFGAAPSAHPKGYTVDLDQLPVEVREALRAEGYEGRLKFGFRSPVPHGGQLITRSHPLVVALAEHLTGRALDGAEAGGSEPSVLGRYGAWRTSAVTKRCEVYLLRLRFTLTMTRGDHVTSSLVEEPVLVAKVGAQDPGWAEGAEVRAWLEAPPTGDLAEVVRRRWRESLPEALADLSPRLESVARDRAEILLADHRRVREASRARGSFAVKPLLPVDVMGAWLLLPEDRA